MRNPREYTAPDTVTVSAYDHCKIELYRLIFYHFRDISGSTLQPLAPRGQIRAALSVKNVRPNCRCPRYKDPYTILFLRFRLFH